MAKAKVATQKDVDLNRWCIEMAIRWPVVRVEPRYGNAVGGIQPGYHPNISGGEADADVIGRAAKIAAWIKEVH